MIGKHLRTVSISASALSVLLSISGIYIISLLPLALAIICFKLGSSKSSAEVDREAEEFLDNMLKNKHKGTIKNIAASLGSRHSFSDQVTKDIILYQNSNACNLNFRSSRSDVLNGVLSTISECMRLGADIHAPLKQMKQELDISKARNSKYLSLFSSASQVMALGSVIFFPAFSGISMNIARFSGNIMHGGLDITMLEYVFIAFILFMNISNFVYDLRDSMRFEKSAMSAAVGVLVFTLSMRFASIML